MQAFAYSNSPWPIREDLSDAFRYTWSKLAAPGNWLTVQVWGAEGALWATAWSSQSGPHYVAVTGLFWDIGPGDLHMAKKIGARTLDKPFALQELLDLIDELLN